MEVVEELGKRYYYHKDEQRSTKYLSNEEKEIKNIYWYDSYGRSRGKIEGVENRIRYTGQLYEEELEGYYVRARNYREEYGRFLEEDVYEGDGLNLYAYCKNNPVMYYDPSGYSGSPNNTNGKNHDTGEKSQSDKKTSEILKENDKVIEGTNKVKTNIETYIDSSGNKVEREYVEESYALDLLDELAGGQGKFDSDFEEFKPDWYINKDRV